MNTASRPLIRDLAALVIIAAAVPVAFYGGVGMACNSNVSDCAFRGAAVIAPLILLVAGAVAAILTSGWPGLGFVVVGMLAGLVSVPFLSAAGGNPVPVDPFSAIFAFALCAPPVVLGYGAARGAARLIARPR